MLKFRDPVALTLTVAVTFACSNERGPFAKDKDSSESSSSPSDEDSPGPDEDSDKGTDEPVWINGSYLTCAWHAAASATTAGVRCEIKAAQGADLSGVNVEKWRVKNDAGQDVESQVTAEGTGVSFVLEAKTISGLSPEATLSDGQVSRTLSARFSDLLEAMTAGGALDECFAGELTVGDCFQIFGIKLAPSDVFARSLVKTEESACVKNENLPDGAACSVDSDALAGDYDQARDYLQEGNDLVQSDGTIRAADFCDAKGVKEKYGKKSIDRTVRRYPNWIPSTHEERRSACFAGFHAKGSENTPAYGRRVLFDQKAGVDGEPFCFFVLISEPNAFGGHFLRMHILKNPKVFPDAVNPVGLTRSSLEKTADYFACP